MAEAFGIACHELVSLDFRCGSQADLLRPCSERPKLGVKQTKSARKQTSVVEGPLLEVKQTCRSAGSDFCL